MANKEQQVKNSFLYLLPVVAGNLIPLMTLPVFTRILTREDYGVYGLAQVYAALMSGVANLGLMTGYERNFFQYRDGNEASELLYSTVFFVMGLIFIIGVFTFIFRSRIAALIIGSREQGDILFWCYCSTGIMGLKNYYLAYFKNCESAKDFVRYTIDESVLGAILSLFMVAYLRIGLLGLVWGQLSAGLIVFLDLSANFMRRHKAAFNIDMLKDSLKLSVPLTPKIFLGAIGGQFDKYLIGLLSSVGGVGVYSIGQKMANIGFSYMTSVQNVFSPQVYKRMFDLGDKGGESVGRYLTPFAYVSVFFCMLIGLFSEEVILILTPVSYHGAIDIAAIFTMVYGLMFFDKQPQLVYARRTYMSTVLNLAAIAISLPVTIPFVLKWGARGAAFGILTGAVISGAISFCVYQRYYRIRWEYGKILSMYLLFFASSIAVIILRDISVYYPARFSFKLVLCVFYLYLGVKFRVITTENYRIVRHVTALKWMAAAGRK